MRKWIYVAISILVAAHAVAAAPPVKQTLAGKLTASDLATFPGMRATDLGCMLEKRFGVHDKRLNCAADFDSMDWGDACTAGKYYAGPQLPSQVAKTLPAPFKKVTLKWEHGEVQFVSIDFDSGTSAREIEALMGFRVEGTRPSNVRDAGIQECSGEKSCTPQLSLVGFEHLGAADFECDKPEKKK